MMKFRKRPIVIEAVQWFPGVEVEGVVYVQDQGPSGCSEGDPYPIIHTLEGPHTVSSGDWIITGIKGEKYPCKPDIFAATYEPVALG